ncbi:MAG: hypothetical protein KC501_29005 [Myxococcales bacterium]|nr:hypothetical protein [Myxococcales bacterium]
MCLFAVDGTWSVDFNNENLGVGSSGRAVGNRDENVRSNTRRFFEECKYPDNKKFYFVGPGMGATGADSWRIYFNVLRTIEREINSGNCTEIVMVGWSRGAAIISELTEGLSSLGQSNSRRDPFQTGRGERMRTINNVLPGGKLPPIRYVGLFDSVAMIMRAAPHDQQWGEDITAEVEYFAHVVAGDRTGPLGGLVDFREANPLIQAKRRSILHMAHVTHGGVGGESQTDSARQAYDFIRNHATIAGVP